MESCNYVDHLGLKDVSESGIHGIAQDLFNGKQKFSVAALCSAISAAHLDTGGF